MASQRPPAARWAARRLHDLAHRAAGGRWLATGGGGYQWARVVPRAWTASFAEMAGVEVDDELPAGWREQARRALGEEVPATLSEPAVAGGVGLDAVGSVMADVKRHAFALHGL